MKNRVKSIVLIVLASLLALSLAGCYPMRIARNPNPTDDPKEALATETPTEEPVITDEPADTDEPTAEPTDEPAQTDEPTAAPADTDEPTAAPTESEGSTEAPTEAPTEGPTPAPTPAPTATPTPTPTPAPTPAPTEAYDPEFHFSTVDIVSGKSYSQNDFKKAPMTMINVWATWCGPCIGELPHIQQLSAAYSGRLQIWTVLYDSGNGGVPGAIDIMNNLGFTVPCLAYNSSMQSAFGSPHLTPPALPTTFFIDNTGHLVKVVKGSHDYAQWCAEINAILNG